MSKNQPAFDFEHPSNLSWRNMSLIAMSGEPNNRICYTVSQFYPDPKVCIPLSPHHPIWPTWASTKMPQWWLPASQHGQGLFLSPHRSATVLLKRIPLQDSEKNDEYLLSHHILVKMRCSIRYPPVCVCVCIIYIYYTYIYILVG